MRWGEKPDEDLWDIYGDPEPEPRPEPRSRRVVPIVVSCAITFAVTGYFLADQLLDSGEDVAPVASVDAEVAETAPSEASEAVVFGGAIRSLEGGFSAETLSALDDIALPPGVDARAEPADTGAPVARVAAPSPAPVAVEAAPAVAAAPAPAETSLPDNAPTDRPAESAAAPAGDSAAAEPPSRDPPREIQPPQPTSPVQTDQPTHAATVPTAAAAEADVATVPDDPIQSASQDADTEIVVAKADPVAERPETVANPVAEAGPGAPLNAVLPASRKAPEDGPQLSGAPPEGIDEVMKRISETVRVAAKAKEEAVETAAEIASRLETDAQVSPTAVAPDETEAVPPVAPPQSEPSRSVSEVPEPVAGDPAAPGPVRPAAESAPDPAKPAAPAADPAATAAARGPDPVANATATADPAPATASSQPRAEQTTRVAAAQAATGPVVDDCVARLRDDLAPIALLFPADDAEVHPDHGDTIRALVGRAQACEPAMVDIRGHAAEEGDTDHMLQLSRERAESVAEALQEAGLDRRRFRSLAFGDRIPRSPGDGPEHLRVNRRVEFTIRVDTRDRSGR
ncbi:MAG: OmpA family protein [Pseudomonadota bacterium]